MSDEMERIGRQAGAGATIATVERAVNLLMHIADGPGPDFGITELADDLGMSKAAVHRVLASLRGSRLVELDERTRRYTLGVGALRLGQAYLDRLDIRRLARPELERLAAVTNETATLSLLAGARQRIYVDQVTPMRDVIMSITLGEPISLHAGASGRAFLAFLDEASREDYLATDELVSLTDRTLVDTAQLREVLAGVKERGWSSSVQERKAGAASVAAPVLDYDEHPVAVISVCGPQERFAAELDLCREELLRSTHVLSTQFGWRPRNGS